MNDWRTVAIGELCTGIFDGPHATPRKTTSGPVFLGISSLDNGRLDLSDIEHLSEEDFARWTRRVTPQPDDVVFSYETRLGEAARIPDGLRCCLGRRMALMRPNPSKVVPRFLLYAYLGPEFQDTLRARTIHGSTVDRIALTDFPRFPIRVPPIGEQEGIARILGSLDDKIELNRQMNETLEALASAIFASTFARDARDQWPEGQIEQLVAVSREILDPRSHPDEEFDLYSIPAFDNGRRPQLEVGDSIRSGKLLLTPEIVLLSKLNPRIPRVWLPEVSAARRSLASTEFLALRPRRPYTRELIYCLVSSDPFLETFTTFATGTSGSHQRVRPRSFLGMKVAVPPSREVEGFTQAVAPLFRRVSLNLRESDTLVKLRDTLLPKLISGEIRVKEAEEMIDA